MSFFRSGPAFSMMPLCTTAMSSPQLTWGWAFACVGAPCVAQRVCAMPTLPCGAAPLPTLFSSSRIRPTALWVDSCESWMMEMPAES